MNSHTAEVRNTPTAADKTLRTWSKPVATAAEVAKATLGPAGPNTNTADISGCTS